MIDLERTRAGLLAAIGARSDAVDAATDPTDPRLSDSDARLLLRGHTREQLFPVVEAVLSERLAAVPRARLLRDLLVPLRSALGNAHKRGNRGDAAKWLAVEIVLSRHGALVAITDEGDGFDVAGVLGHRRNNERYFAHRGAGFSRFERAESIVSYEEGGRTLLIAFRATAAPPPQAGPSREADRGSSASIERAGKRATSRGHGSRSLAVESALDRVTDPAWVRSRFSTDLPELALSGASLESVRAAEIAGESGTDRDLRYVLRVGGDQSPVRIRVLSGRLHADAGAADAELASVARLHSAPELRSVTIPRTLGRLGGEPRLVLFDLHPWMNLGEYLSDRGDRWFLPLRCEKIGRALARLHRSGFALGGQEPELLETHFHHLCAGIRGGLAARGASRVSPRAASNHVGRSDPADRIGRLAVVDRRVDLEQRLRHLQTRLGAQIGTLEPRPLCSIHGRFGFDSIQYTVDGAFHLYRFEACRRSHPGLDIGGFLADLASWASTQSDQAMNELGREAFLAGYNARTDPPVVNPTEINAFVALALLDRLHRVGPLTGSQVEAVLERCEASLEVAACGPRFV